MIIAFHELSKYISLREIQITKETLSINIGSFQFHNCNRQTFLNVQSFFSLKSELDLIRNQLDCILHLNSAARVELSQKSESFPIQLLGVATVSYQHRRAELLHFFSVSLHICRRFIIETEMHQNFIHRVSGNKYWSKKNDTRTNSFHNTI